MFSMLISGMGKGGQREGRFGNVALLHRNWAKMRIPEKKAGVGGNWKGEA